MQNDDIGFLVKKLSEAIDKQANQDLKQFQLTLSQLRVLDFLESRKGKVQTSQKEIEKFLQVSHPTVVGILNSMESKGFIRTWLCEKDHRIKLVELAGAKKGTTNQFIVSRNRMEMKLVSGFTNDEQEDIRKYLKRMYQNIIKEDFDD